MAEVTGSSPVTPISFFPVKNPSGLRGEAICLSLFSLWFSCIVIFLEHGFAPVYLAGCPQVQGVRTRLQRAREAAGVPSLSPLQNHTDPVAGSATAE